MKEKKNSKKRRVGGEEVEVNVVLCGLFVLTK